MCLGTTVEDCRPANDEKISLLMLGDDPEKGARRLEVPAIGSSDGALDLKLTMESSFV